MIAVYLYRIARALSPKCRKSSLRKALTSIAQLRRFMMQNYIVDMTVFTALCSVNA